MPAATLARSVLLEARRGGLPWLVAASLVAGLALATFLSQVALTERAALQAAALAAVLRACAVFLVAAQVSSSTLRELHDKGLELMLSLPLSRATHYLGRFAGYVVCGAAIAAVFALALLLWAPPGAVALWGFSYTRRCSSQRGSSTSTGEAFDRPAPARRGTAMAVARARRSAFRATRLAGGARPGAYASLSSAAAALGAGAAAGELRRGRSAFAAEHALSAGFQYARARLRPADRLARRGARARSAQPVPSLRRFAHLCRTSRRRAQPRHARIRVSAIPARSGSALALACPRRAPRQAPPQGPAARPALCRGDPALHARGRRAA